jgi:hypothetical protein
MSAATQTRREETMKVNVGGLDRVLRIVAGIVLLALTAMGTIGLWGLVGIVLLATGLFRFCPAYSIFGLSTCPLKTATHPQ